MASDREALAAMVINHLVDIAGGRFTVTQEEILESADHTVQEVLTGLLLLREDLDHQAAQRLEAEDELRRTVDELQGYQQRLQSLNRIAVELTRAGNLETLLQRTVDEACELVGASLGVLVGLAPETGKPAGVYQYGFDMEAIPAGVEVTGRGVLGHLLGGGSVFSDDVTSVEAFDHLPHWHPGVGPTIGVPVIHGDAVQAILLVGRGPDAPPFENKTRSWCRPWPAWWLWRSTTGSRWRTSPRPTPPPIAPTGTRAIFWPT